MKKFEDRLLHPINPLRTCIIIFLFFFAITTIINLPYITMPPVLDNTAVFSPAIYLFENNFDFSGLLKEDGYLNGGPNIHSFSLINFLTYLIISLFNGNPVLFIPALHLIQFAFAGAALTCTFYIALRLLGVIVALAIAMTVLLYPLFLVQTGHLYMEIAGAALVLSSILAWASRYLISAVVLAACACMVKSFGVVLMTSLAFLFLFDDRCSKSKRIFMAFVSVLIMTGIELIKMGSTSGYSFDRSNYFVYFLSVFMNLNFLPDLKILVFFALIMPGMIYMTRSAVTKENIIEAFSAQISGNTTQRLLVLVYLIPFVFIGFIATVPLSGMGFIPLLRYYIWILPLMFIGTIYAFYLFLKSTVEHHSKLGFIRIDVLLAMLVIFIGSFFIVNSDGRYYPSLGKEIASFGSVERSYEFLDYYKIQRESVLSLVEFQNSLPAFVTLGEYYYLSSPLMGYVKKPVKKIHLLVNKPYNAAKLADFPDEFLLLDVPNNRIHGGKIVKEILENAYDDPRYSVFELVRHHRGPYISSIYRISRKIELAVPH